MKGTWGTVGKLLAWTFSFIVSLAAWQTSQDAAKSARDAAETAKSAMQIQEATSLLSVAPHIEVVQAVFHPSGDPPYPPHILLYNSGRIDALAVTIELNIYEGFIHPNGAPSLSYKGMPIPQWVGDIPAHKPHPPHLVPTQSTQPFAGVPDERRASRHRFIQLIIQYLRPSDRHAYDRRFYYFVGSAGTWVSENDPDSDHTAFNRRIKQALKHPDYLRDTGPSVFDPAHVTTE
jgi:hypothetical protein